jgi:hypothetical protein
MLPAIFPLLRDSAAVTALIGSSPVRAYRHGVAPQNVVAPYVTWSVPGGNAENGLDGAKADVFRVQVDCWSDSPESTSTAAAQVEALASAVRAAIEPAAHLQAYVANEQDAETKRYRISMQFDWIGLR